MAKKSAKAQKEHLFEESLVPGAVGSGKLFDVNYEYGKSKPVECLGMSFPNDEARRTYFTEKLRERLKDPAFRKIDGFPIGEDDDIIAASDPPYYTACPNPWLSDFISLWESDRAKKNKKHQRQTEPFAADVTEGKNDPIFNAHSYHTKVPYRAIQKYIEHFSEPGDIIADPFCGTGMTALSAASLDRRAIVSDLSPYATFIAYNYCRTIDQGELERTWKSILASVSHDLSWLYESVVGESKGEVQYVVWSDHYFCPSCSKELVFWDILINENEEFRDVLRCNHCDAVVDKSDLVQVRTSKGDVKRSIVKIYEARSGRKVSRRPNRFDSELAERCSDLVRDLDVPRELMLFKGERFGDMFVPRQHTNLNRVDQFYMPRSLIAASKVFNALKSIDNIGIRHYLVWAFLSVQNYINKKQSYFGGGGGQPGTLTIADIIQEKNVFEVLNRKVTKLVKLLPQMQKLITDHRRSVASTQSATSMSLVPDDSIDYIFTDPPFGRNLMYSELNFINESWLKVFTQQTSEAIVNKTQKKAAFEYRQLMLSAFKEAYRILKPGRWMTVEFSNTKASIWNSIQTALSEAGFLVANVSALDKKQGTFKAVTTPTAVKQDLIISAYKPTGNFEARFEKEAQTEEGVWEFVKTHLEHLLVTKFQGTVLQTIPERDPRILFDQMVSYYVRKGYLVPISSREFQAGLLQRFVERDGMFFLPQQVVNYDRCRLEAKEVQQYELFVSDEKSAIQWVRRQLLESPLTFQELSPIYMKEAQRVWDKHEQPLELRTILEQNFIENRRGEWCVPDPKNESHLEQLRHRALLKEFQHYVETKGKLKVIRIEALRAGFKESWQKKEFSTIVKIASRVPESVIQEDPALLMYFDNASLLIGD